MRKIAKYDSFFLFLSFLLIEGCATRKAAEVRSKRPVSIEVGTAGFGGKFRPNDSFSVGVITGGLSRENEDFEITSRRQRETLGTNSFEVADYQMQHTIFWGQYFPWKDSAFYLGLAAKRMTETFRFGVAQTPGAGLHGGGTDPELNLSSGEALVAYDLESLQLKVPFGWSWIWEGGFSLMLELGGPIIRFDQKEKYALNGVSEGVSESRRDQKVSVLKQYSGEDSVISPLINLGYSF